MRKDYSRVSCINLHSVKCRPGLKMFLTYYMAPIACKKLNCVTNIMNEIRAAALIKYVVYM